MRCDDFAEFGLKAVPELTARLCVKHNDRVLSLVPHWREAALRSDAGQQMGQH